MNFWNLHTVSQTRELKVGNDVKMPIGQHEAVMQALADGKISRAEIEVCVKRLLGMIMKID